MIYGWLSAQPPAMSWGHLNSRRSETRAPSVIPEDSTIGVDATSPATQGGGGVIHVTGEDPAAEEETEEEECFERDEIKTHVGLALHVGPSPRLPVSPSPRSLGDGQDGAGESTMTGAGRLGQSIAVPTLKHRMQLCRDLRVVAGNPHDDPGENQIRRLLDSGAFVDATDTTGTTALLIAASSGNPACKWGREQDCLSLRQNRISSRRARPGSVLVSRLHLLPEMERSFSSWPSTAAFSAKFGVPTSLLASRGVKSCRCHR